MSGFFGLKTGQLARVDQTNTFAGNQTLNGSLTVNGNAAVGANNQSTFKATAVIQRIDTRSTTMTYDSNGNLTQIVESDGTTTVKTTTFTYSGGNLTQVKEVVGGNTITTTLTYDANNNLVGTSRTVS